MPPLSPGPSSGRRASGEYLPTPPPDADSTYPGLNSVMEAIPHMCILLAAFDLNPGELESYKAATTRSLLDRWKNAVLWFRHLLRSYSPKDGAGISTNCIEFLKQAMLVSKGDENL